MQRLAETEAVLAIIRILFVLITPALDELPGLPRKHRFSNREGRGGFLTITFCRWSDVAHRPRGSRTQSEDCAECAEGHEGIVLAAKNHAKAHDAVLPAAEREVVS
jgi:hypothetical protein